MTSFKANIERQWYSRPDWLLLLLPVNLLFILVALVRRKRLVRAAIKPPVPVIVVGNISIGGTGKTPVIIALVKALTAAGLRPGVVSRGYGSAVEDCRIVHADGAALQFGDEPILIARMTGCPVVVGADRVKSAEILVHRLQCNVILSDDGLQHYRLGRDIEIAVVDGRRKFGNGWRLPIGPLRESPARLNQVDWVLVNGGRGATGEPLLDSAVPMVLRPTYWLNVQSGEELPLDDLTLQGAHAVAGIGNPERFASTLRGLGFDGQLTTFPDHYAYQQADFAQFSEQMVVMTAKDAVKCQAFAQPNWWALVVEAQLPAIFVKPFLQRIRASR